LTERANSIKYVWDDVWRSDPYNSSCERHARARRRLAAIEPCLAPNADLGNVLELGCGDGSYADCLAQSNRFHVATYVGIDLSPTALDRARSSVRDTRFRFQLADISSVDFPTDSADTVFMLGVLEHLLDSSNVLARLQRVLRPNGRLILTTSNTLSLMYVKRRLREALQLWPYGYQRNYTPSEFRSLLAPHFEEQVLEPFQGDWDFPLVAVVDRAAAWVNKDFSRYILAVCNGRRTDQCLSSSPTS
jgi:SAM-dependent methyltransferase